MSSNKDKTHKIDHDEKNEWKSSSVN